MIVRLCCALSIFLSSLVLPAQSTTLNNSIDIESIGRPPLDEFSVGDGLPDLAAVSVSSTPDGHLWVGTMRGLARFNGLRFVTVELPGTDRSNMINSVLALDDNEVWAARTNDGLYRWNGQKWLGYAANKEFPGVDIRRLRAFDTPQGRRLFAATSTGVVAEFNGKQWLARPLPAAIADKQIFDVLLLPAKNPAQEVLYIASYGAGLYQCIGKSVCTPVTIKSEPRFFEISSLRSLHERDGSISIWAGSYAGGVARLQHGQWQRFTQESGALTGNNVHDLEVITSTDGESEVWVGTRNGLSRFRNGQWLRYDNKDPLSNRRIRSLAKSQNAQGQVQLWAGTDEGVVRLHLRGDWRTVSRVSNNANGVWAVKFEHDDNGHERLWLGSDGDGLHRYENGEWTRFGIESGLPVNIVRSLARTPGGPLWVGLWNGHVAVQNGEKFQEIATPWPKDDSEAVSTIYAMKNGNLWVGLRRGGIAMYNGKQWQWFERDKTPAPERVLSFVNSDSEEKPVLWITSLISGLHRFSEGKLQVFNMSNSELPDNDLAIANLYPDKTGRPVLWIGTRHSGLIRMDISDINKPHLVMQPRLPEPPNRYVYGAVKNSHGDLLLCSDYGAAFWQLEKNGQYRATDYHRANGIPHDECNAGALSIDYKGRAWIGTIGGAAVHTNMDAPSIKPAQLTIERIRVNSIDIDQPHEKRLRIETSNAHIDFEFALLTGEREPESLYRMQLIGLEDKPGQWQQSNERSLGNLPPGDYVFKVEAKNYAGVLANPIEIAISVPKPWWRSSWGIGFIFFSILTGMLVLFRWRVGALRQRAKHLAHLVKERTDELEKRGIELHKINNELTRLSYFDPLTELPNRRRLLEQLESTWNAAHQKNESLAVILIDVDNFKSVNDHYGHLVGDDYLRRIAKIIEDKLVNTDNTAGRYGGEEFGIVLPGQNLIQAAAFAEKIRAAVENENIMHVGSSHGRLTISSGVASIRPLAGTNPELIIADADAALYLAKNNGKNRVELSTK